MENSAAIENTVQHTARSVTPPCAERDSAASGSLLGDVERDLKHNLFPNARGKATRRAPDGTVLRVMSLRGANVGEDDDE